MHIPMYTSSWSPLEDESALQLWQEYAEEHTRLAPYLAAHAQKGIPFLTPPEIRFDGWRQNNCWLLGEQLLVIPITDSTSDSLLLNLPSEGNWYSYWTGEQIESGTHTLAVDEIMVLVPENSLIPLFNQLPSSASEEAREEADTQRLLKLYGSSGTFVEADGSRYNFEGKATEPSSTEAELQEGTLQLGEITIELSGPKIRNYRIEHYP